MTELPPRILRSRLQLMLAHPYLAAALARLPVVNAADLAWCRTMATDGYHIFVNPAFCEELPEAEIAGVFAHEVMHAVLGHIDRRGERNRHLWGVAIDYATNLLLKEFGFALPSCGLYDQRYQGMTAEQIYERLEKLLGPLPRLGFDLHLEPGDAEGQAEREDDFPSADERRRLRAILLDSMQRDLLRRGQGLPGELQRGAELATKTQVTWQQVLARFFNGLRRSDYRLFPFNKKHLWRGIYLPSLGIPGPDHLMLAIDTSGSISEADLGRFLAELDRLRAQTECRMTVLQCDAAVQRIHEVAAGETTILPGAGSGARVRLAGGGGTDFRPVFNWVAERMRGGATPDALIYCTDGYGTFPPRAPSYPVVWVVTASGKPQFPFGMTIRLQPD